MAVYSKIIESYPELEGSELFANGTILLQDDADGEGSYIVVWEYEKPLPKGLKVGK